MNKKLFLITVICIIIDQVVKVLVSSLLNVGTSLNIISNFFNITYVHNTGAAFSILTGNRIFLIVVTILVLILIYSMLKNKELITKDSIIYGVLLGGIMGNFIDRIIHGYVIDYLDFNILGYDFAIFNLADVMIVLSVLALLILTFKEDKNARDNSNRK